jgi:photosystem II stability/assembly factor-like uncharacterized protein
MKLPYSIKLTFLYLASLGLNISEISAQGSWYLPGPQGKSLIPYTGCFTDSRTGFAVKDPNRTDTAAAIQKTVDGGTTWASLFSGPSIPLRSIHFPRHNLGYVMATNGTTLLKTIDAGSNWVRWEANRRLDNIQFKSDSTGYARPDSGGFLKSIDGGKTWYPVALGGVHPDYFYFGTERIGFIVPRTSGISVESTLAKTKDGGTTWEWLTGTPKIEEMTFLDSVTGLATGIQISPAKFQNSTPSAMGVYKTTDGGSTWKVVLSSRVEESGPYWHYQKPNLVTPTLGYVIANMMSNSGPTLGSRIMKTMNGGNTWTIDYETSDLHIFDLQFLELNTGYAKAATVVGITDKDNAILIKHRLPTVTILPKLNRHLPTLHLEKGILVFGEKMSLNALGRTQFRF